MVAAGATIVCLLVFATGAVLLGRPHNGALVVHAAAGKTASAARMSNPATPAPTARPAPVETFEEQVKGEGVVLMDVDSGRVLWARDPRTPRAPASLAKLLTAMVAADLAPLDRPILVTHATDTTAVRAVEPASTVMGLSAGEVLTVRELLYGLFLRSGNDAAETLAAGIVPRGRFIDLMNAKAAALGMRDSHFTSPVGLDDPSMRTTPYDLALAASAIVRTYPSLLAISGTPSIQLPAGRQHKVYEMDNYNRLVRPGPASYAGATGMKTAFTDDAGPCMVATATRGNRRLAVVVMHSSNFFADARALLDRGFGGAPAGN